MSDFKNKLIKILEEHEEKCMGYADDYDYDCNCIPFESPSTKAQEESIKSIMQLIHDECCRRAKEKGIKLFCFSQLQEMLKEIEGE